MDKIRVMKKPDWVSWEEIHEVLKSAQTVNRRRGFNMINANLSGEKLKKKVGDGLCVVALDGDKVIATQSVTLLNGDKWYSKGQKVAHYCLTAILKKYQGCGIKEMLDNECAKFIAQTNPDILQANTAENNLVVLNSAHEQGFIDTQCVTFKGTDYYSVWFALWRKKCPFPIWYCRFRYRLSVIYTKTRYKPGKIERFKTIALAVKACNKIKRSFRK